MLTCSYLLKLIRLLLISSSRIMYCVSLLTFDVDNDWRTMLFISNAINFQEEEV